MVRMRFDRRRAPLVRTWAMMRMDVVKQKPAWFDAVRAFPAPHPFKNDVNRKQKVPRIEYLEDKLLEDFHRLYLSRFKEPYIGVNHLAGTMPGKNSMDTTYRNQFVTVQADIMRQNPYLSREQAFNIAADRLENVRKSERNKQAAMTRFILDPKSEHLDRTLSDLRNKSEGKVVSRALSNLRSRIVDDNKLWAQMKAASSGTDSLNPEDRIIFKHGFTEKLGRKGKIHRYKN